MSVWWAVRRCAAAFREGRTGREAREGGGGGGGVSEWASAREGVSLECAEIRAGYRSWGLNQVVGSSGRELVGGVVSVGCGVVRGGGRVEGGRSVCE